MSRHFSLRVACLIIRKLYVPRISLYARNLPLEGERQPENELSHRSNVAREPSAARCSRHAHRGCAVTKTRNFVRENQRRILHESRDAIEFFSGGLFSSSLVESSLRRGKLRPRREREREASAVRRFCEIAYSVHGPVAAGRFPFPLEKLISDPERLRVAYRSGRAERLHAALSAHNPHSPDHRAQLCADPAECVYFMELHANRNYGAIIIENGQHNSTRRA